jgi:flagellar assembly protein FliH
MISPSENEEAITTNGGDARQPFLRLTGADGREVSRLEFYPLNGLEAADEVELDGEPEESVVLLKEEIATLDGRLVSEAQRMSTQVEIARSEAKSEARREWEMELEKRIVEERAFVMKVGDDFRRERSKYFAGVEGEVVKLALAIAARVLHREAQLDPLLLAGVVRVALEKVAEGSSAVLRVPASELGIWQQVIAADSESSLQLVGDERLGLGECVVDTSVGKVELGVSAQLKEIERGFFDLMQQRPA